MIDQIDFKRKLTSKIRKHKQLIILFGLLIAGFLLRIYFADKFIKESGDLRLYADWGEKFWEYGSKEFYFFEKWYYSPPNYPPLLSLIYAGSYWLYDHKYVLAQIHNATKLVPAFFIVYFYDHGYYLLLKLPGILADLGLAYLIYKVVFQLTNNTKRALAAFSFYLFNPISIFLSGAWGQTDSLVAFFGMLSFLVLFTGNAWLSIPLLFISFYIKPNFGVFIPLYILLFIVKRPKIAQVAFGLFFAFIVFYLTTEPFAKEGLASFISWLAKERLLPTATVTHKASVSAFNFHTIFFTIDKTSDKAGVLGIPANIFGLIIYFLTNILSFIYLKRKKYSLESIMVALFAIGFSSFLFWTNMLERYFFSSYVPLIVVAFADLRMFKYMILISLTTFLNLIYSFFRRTVGVIADLLTKDNFLMIRTLSVVNLISWYFVLKQIYVVKFKGGANNS
ncbi:MAG: Integral membrane protein-like protein [Candidatus Woesebacteria bacterium GW2011_GWB1_39_12]|uniref:Integral membrane protein-like protein n=2 Tax=Candidatus Woeseibacteriota TaxID=1752722 RepID=A0A0G0LXV9_9BACT|nr:MAG: Integral membrane protein-like protein [Candidatus Woesebacteria bacterium GW2011_GWA1_39_12]KKR00342.1 MAG: Integral membrane protein-like protein [Candidatus Woesebacteria bacterium GW2011_GWB1_39_12]